MTFTKCIFWSDRNHGAGFVERLRLLVAARRDVPLRRQSTLFDFHCMQYSFIRVSALRFLPLRNMYFFLSFPEQLMVNPTQPTFYSFSFRFRTLSLILIYMLGSCIMIYLFRIEMNICSTTNINPRRIKSDTRICLQVQATVALRYGANVYKSHHRQERHNTTFVQPRNH